jgi:hypothetical protein
MIDMDYIQEAFFIVFIIVSWEALKFIVNALDRAMQKEREEEETRIAREKSREIIRIETKEKIVKKKRGKHGRKRKAHA